MILKNEFPIEASIDRVWSLVNEIERLVPCMPGAAYEGRNGEDYDVSMKVKIGAITSHFNGALTFLERDDATHTAIVRGVGKDKNGKGAATATVTTKLEALSAERTRVVVNTDLSMTGRLAQFGSGVISDIASLLIKQFSDNLHREVLARSSVGEGSGATAAAIAEKMAETKQPREQAPIDLGPVVGSVGLKYLQKLVVPIVCLLIGWLIGRVY